MHDGGAAAHTVSHTDHTFHDTSHHNFHYTPSQEPNHDRHHHHHHHHHHHGDTSDSGDDWAANQAFYPPATYGTIQQARVLERGLHSERPGGRGNCDIQTLLAFILGATFVLAILAFAFNVPLVGSCPFGKCV